MLPATGLRTHGWNTALRSSLLLAGFPVLLAMMGYALALLLVSAEAPSVADGMRRAAGLLPVIIPAALLLAGAWFAIAWAAHNRILDAVTGARRIADPREAPRLWQLTETLCISRGMRMPRLAVIPSRARNAFATGLTPDKAGVTVTQGLLDALDDREVSAVLAHELAHIRNGDARLGVVAAVFVGVITLITDTVWQGLRMWWHLGRAGRRIRRGSSGGGMGGGAPSSSRNKGGGAAVVLVLVGIAILIAILAHLLAVVLRLALSRNREVLADAGAVEMTQDADAMITALRKVEQRPDLPGVPEQVRALFLHDRALARGARWFATHPPIEDRIALLVRYGGGHDPGKLPDLPEDAEDGEQGADTVLAAPRTPPQERRHAVEAFLRSRNLTYMDNQARRDAARRAGQDPDAAAPPPPRG
ncbi:MAG: M48 family metalloprotease [Roseomonas sp.]|nr:M48 family metalloprotease [Roseomonas sp.]